MTVVLAHVGRSLVVMTGHPHKAPGHVPGRAVRRIPLSSLAFLQFLGPTSGFVIGVAQGEPFTPLRAASFLFIWGGAVVFAVAAWKRSRPELAATELVEPAE